MRNEYYKSSQLNAFEGLKLKIKRYMFISSHVTTS